MATKTENEIIAEFMGIESEFEYDVIHYAYDEYFRGWISEESLEDVKHLNKRIRDIPYDQFWDLLMPVVEKINEQYHKAFPKNKEFIRRIMAHEYTGIEPYMEVIAIPLATPIKEVYEAVSEVHQMAKLTT